MTEKQIQVKLDKVKAKEEHAIGMERSEFYNAIYDGELPHNFMELFKKAIFCLAPMIDNILSGTLKEWFKIELKELNFGRVSKMTEVIAMAPRDKMFDNLDQSFEMLSPIEVISLNVREKKQVFEFEIQKKKDKLNEKLHKMKFSLQNTPGTVKSSKQENAMASV